ncbi:DUF3696 domain-containing protein [Desulfobacterales bacterium HSG2]|nr:DUF3696 domain-containing protein [Desulfobacterales bacterium HSG2]
MKISLLALKNFKGWREVELPLGQITVLFGTNSSGKSSILQSILLLKQTVESFDRDRVLHFGEPHRDYVELGDFRETVYGHNPENEMEIGILWHLPNPLANRSEVISDIKYNARFRLTDDHIVLWSLQYSTEKLKIGIQKDLKDYRVFGNDFEKKIDSQIASPPISCYRIPPEAVKSFPSIDQYLFPHEFEKLLQCVLYLGPLRQPPERLYRWSGAGPGSLGMKGEDAVQAILANLKYTHPDKRKPPIDIREKVEKWMKRLGVAENVEFTPVEHNGRLYDFRITVQDDSYQVSIADAGVGVSQLLPVIVQLYFAPRGSVLIFEQPEIHLHPSVQAALADLFIEAAEEMNHQIIIESHSEHFLVRMQRRIAESEMELAKKEHIRLYCFEIENKCSYAKELNLDNYGKIENWPDNFFGDTLGDREAIMRAMIRRKAMERRS